MWPLGALGNMYLSTGRTGWARKVEDGYGREEHSFHNQPVLTTACTPALGAPRLFPGLYLYCVLTPSPTLTYTSFKNKYLKKIKKSHVQILLQIPGKDHFFVKPFSWTEVS